MAGGGRDADRTGPSRFGGKRQAPGEGPGGPTRFLMSPGMAPRRTPHLPARPREGKGRPFEHFLTHPLGWWMTPFEILWQRVRAVNRGGGRGGAIPTAPGTGKGLGRLVLPYGLHLLDGRPKASFLQFPLPPPPNRWKGRWARGRWARSQLRLYLTLHLLSLSPFPPVSRRRHRGRGAAVGHLGPERHTSRVSPSSLYAASLIYTAQLGWPSSEGASGT